MTLYIKYMVSLRCKLLVKDELTKIGLPHAIVDLGTVELLKDLTEPQNELLKTNLLRSGLELLDDKKSILIEKIKNVIIEMIHYSDEIPQVNYSNYIRVSTVKESTKVTDGIQSVEQILLAFKAILSMQREILILAEEATDEGTNALMSDYIRQQEKQVWMYAAFLKK